MERRKALKIAAGSLVGGSVGLFSISKAFKPEPLAPDPPKKLEAKVSETDWTYSALDPAITAELAYLNYDKGSCMYATFKSIVTQLADKIGEPYSSFPVHMMKYGHGGIGGFGTVCGALNAGAAAIGLVVPDKAAQDMLITGLFRWYEQTALPTFSPQQPIKDFVPVSTRSDSALCHASNTRWVKEAGFSINSDERKERCRRLTSDVSARLAMVLNDYFNNAYTTSLSDSEPINGCMSCHSDKGKIANANVRMTCNPCHSESSTHRLFAGVHYKFMD